MLMCTYSSFVLCFIVDIFLVINQYGFTNINTNPATCTSCNSTDVYEYSQAYYNALHVTTVGLNCRINMFSDLVDWEQGSKPDVCSPVTLVYDLHLWTCLKPHGCQNFTSPDAVNPTDDDKWSFAYSDIAYPVETNMCQLKSDGYFFFDFIWPTYVYDVSKFTSYYVTLFLVLQ